MMCVMKSLSYHFERRLIADGYQCVVGVDEVGAGCVAGDVFAGAVVLRPGTRLKGVYDSKRLSEKNRNYWDEIIKERAVAWSIGRASVVEVDRLNIRQAGFLAMRRALDKIEGVDAVLCDGFVLPGIEQYCERVVKGDQKVKSIASASIIAKVARDAYMVAQSKKYPLYGFERHKGYGTKMHFEAIREYGITEIHRKTFLKTIIREEKLRETSV